jgi:glycosyltransferase involved in cell wall biosynthesis
VSLRVLMVTGAYYPELAGGSLQCRTLTNALRHRVRVTVLTTTAMRDAPAYSEVDGVPVHRIYVDPRDRASKLTAAWRLTRLLPRLVQSSDIFHFHGFTEKMVLLLVAAKCAGRRTIEKMTSLGWDDPIAIRRRPFGRLLAAAQASVDRLVAVTPAMRDACRRAGVRDAAIVAIPNGVDAARFSPADDDERARVRERLGLPPRTCLVTFVGFWSREKAPDVLFAAWQQARRRTGADVSLLFIGSSSAEHPEADPSLAARVRCEVERENLAARVFFVERTDDVASHLRASDVFVLPSLREGLSNALLEAMSAGLACVCADIPGVTDAVIQTGVNGWRVPPGDVDALAGLLAALFADEAGRRAAGARARATVLERFAIASVAERYLALYDEVIRS